MGMRKTAQGLRVTDESLVILEPGISLIKPQNHSQSCRCFGRYVVARNLQNTAPAPLEIL